MKIGQPWFWCTLGGALGADAALGFQCKSCAVATADPCRDLSEIIRGVRGVTGRNQLKLSETRFGTSLKGTRSTEAGALQGQKCRTEVVELLGS